MIEVMLNSFPVMAVIFWPLFGLYYSEGHILIKNWTYRVLLGHNTSPFKDVCRFIYLIEAKVALYVFNVLLNIPVPTYLLKTTVECLLGIESGTCNKASKREYYLFYIFKIFDTL
jgi:hypothetical protein